MRDSSGKPGAGLVRRKRATDVARANCFARATDVARANCFARATDVARANCFARATDVARVRRTWVFDEKEMKPPHLCKA